MFIRTMVLLLAFSATFPGFSYENSLPDLSAPSGLGDMEMEFNVVHRFLDPVNVANPNGLFSAGANVGLGLRWMIWNGFEAQVGYGFNPSAIGTGLGYSLRIPQAFLRLKIEARYYNYDDFRHTDRLNDFIPLFSVQSEPLFGFLVLTTNFAYSVYNRDFGGGAGIDIEFLPAMHFLFESILPIAYDADNQDIGDAVFFSIGLKFDVGGHHFMLTLANSPEIDARKHILGAVSYDNWYFGFVIQRLFSF